MINIYLSIVLRGCVIKKIFLSELDSFSGFNSFFKFYHNIKIPVKAEYFIVLILHQCMRNKIVSVYIQGYPQDETVKTTKNS